MNTVSHAWVESPLQFVSAIEACRDGQSLEIHARIDADGMASFLDQFRSEWLPANISVVRTVEIDPQIFSSRGHELLIGDICSGRLQRAMLAAGPQLRRSIVILDDGFATLHAVRLVTAKRPRPLVRARQHPSRSRRAAALAVALMLRSALRRRQLSWTTALPVPDDLIASFTAAGGTFTRHAFDYVRSIRAAADPLPGTIVLGSAMVADDLIDVEPYFAWLDSVVERTGAHSERPLAYFAHRRETPELLNRVAARPGVTVFPAELPVELRLARAPKCAQVHSLPTSAVANLPTTMRSPQIHVTEVPAAWWTGSAPQALRNELNAAAAATLHSGADYRVVAIADSESYLKWASRMLDSLGPDVDSQLWLLDTPIAPTAAQIAHALAGSSRAGATVPMLNRSELRARLESAAPDIVLAAATGPVVQQIAASAHRLSRRPGVASGLPGIGLPARAKGVRYRRDCDLFITHSHHERAAYLDACTKVGVPLELTVTRLPLLSSPGLPRAAFDTLAGETPPVPDRLVFATQAKVPEHREERIAILQALADFRRAHPAAEAIVKVRSLPGEQETHHEEHTYLSLIDELLRSGEIVPGELSVAVGPMSEFLTPGAAVVTVSSTAALEAIDRGLQTLIVSDFGVSDELLNGVFEGSGILGTLDDLRAGRIGFPREAWLQENYFHPPSADMQRALAVLARRSQQRQLSSRAWVTQVNTWRRIRAELRTAAPQPVVDGYRAAIGLSRRIRRRLR